jgi:hypothetical protein
MAASFVAASSQRLRNAAHPLPLTGYPFTVGVWVKVRTLGINHRIFALSDSGSADNHLSLYVGSTDAWRIEGTAGGAEANSAVGTVTTARWSFVLGRFIAAANRRLAVWHSTGNATFSAVQNTVSRAPTSMDMMSIGSLESSSPTDFFDGLIGEFWLANADVLPTDAAISAAAMQSLALGGPFSWPHIAKSIVEYRSLRSHPTAGQGSDIYAGAGVRQQSWENVNGVGIGPHPPLPYWYANPRQRRTLLPF